MQNYHKHTCCSNIYTPDSPATYEQYAKRAVELGQNILCSLEHGWQGKYHECREIAIKYGLKFIFGTEAYWVKDRHEKDRTNCHIVLLAKMKTVVSGSTKFYLPPMRTVITIAHVWMKNSCSNCLPTMFCYFCLRCILAL